MSDDPELKKQIVWINKEDLNTLRMTEKLVKINVIKNWFGIVYICSKDLTKKQLLKLFKHEKNKELIKI